MIEKWTILLSSLVVASFLLSNCATTVTPRLATRPASVVEKAVSQPTTVPGGNPAGTAAAYFKKLKGMPPTTQPLMFYTPEADAVLAHMQVFPADSPFYEEVTQRPVAANSDAMIATMLQVTNKLAYNLDMGYIIVPPDQKLVDVKLRQYLEDCDPGPYPLPDNAPIEGWNPSGDETLDHIQRVGRGDRHIILVDPIRGLLYEFWQGKKTDQGWQAANEATFDMKTNALRPDGWTSSDAAGLPLLPLTVRYADVASGEVGHAIRFTVRRTAPVYVYPATHKASRRREPDLPRMGERFRLKADVDISSFSPHAQAICRGLKKYGMINADNGGDWRISVAPDSRIKGLDDLGKIKGTDFEVIVPTGPNEGPRAPKK